ncbi:MAG TPA: DUF2269 family protein [Marmoricola sp.]|nr:DUF2269 family protein [Marmoricola sp.]
MFTILLALHVLAAVFVIGPLAHAATTASRGLRNADAAATAASSRTAKVYALASLLVVVLGFGLMSAKGPDHRPAGEFSDLWIWLSLLLWLVAVALTLGLLVPTLDRATAAVGRGEAVRQLTGRVAASGGVVGLLMVAVVVLMVYRPGS